MEAVWLLRLYVSKPTTLGSATCRSQFIEVWFLYFIYFRIDGPEVKVFCFWYPFENATTCRFLG